MRTRPDGGELRMKTVGSLRWAAMGVGAALLAGCGEYGGGQKAGAPANAEAASGGVNGNGTAMGEATPGPTPSNATGSGGIGAGGAR